MGYTGGEAQRVAPPTESVNFHVPSCRIPGPCRHRSECYAVHPHRAVDAGQRPPRKSFPRCHDAGRRYQHLVWRWVPERTRGQDRPVLPTRSFRDPTPYQMLIATTGVVASWERFTRRPLSSVNRSMGMDSITLGSVAARAGDPARGHVKVNGLGGWRYSLCFPSGVPHLPRTSFPSVDEAAFQQP